jgi:hypothetical protein
MRRKLMWLVLMGTAFTVTALYVRRASATPAVGFMGTTLAIGRFSEIEVLNQHVPQDPTTNFWLAWQKTIGSSDLYVQNNVWQPGGDTGWHSHPGSSLIIVTEGTVTDYMGDDPACTPHVYTKGMGFIAIQLIPSDAARRIDADNPGNCPF